MSTVRKPTKFIFVTGGVASSLGKGIVASGLGTLLVHQGISAEIMKLDPYLNIDPGTMSPFQHGEVFVTDDGAETDLDLGHYERFLNKPTGRANNVTAGKVYDNVIKKERRGDYLGATVQVIPHITDEVKRRILTLARDKKAEVLIVEVGGTVGDIESLPFLEAIRQIPYDVGKDNCLFIHVTLLPYLSGAGELKTKPTQHSVKALREIGIQPDALVCRTEVEMDAPQRRKIGMFCNVEERAVFQSVNVEYIYEVPLMLHRQGLDEWVVRHVGLEPQHPVDVSEWEALISRIRSARETVRIGVAGKYIDLQDAYISIYEALKAAAWHHGVRPEIVRIDSETPEAELAAQLLTCDGILIPGGFGPRGVEGKIFASNLARERQIPFFGICLGMQVALIAFARHVCGINDANSTEFKEKCENPLVDLMMDQKAVLDLGGTMRLGAYPMKIKPGTKAHELYAATEVSERHRHRYEVNNIYRPRLEEMGLIVSGVFEETDLVEMIELEDHPWYVACQFHPEFQSRPLAPHPLFRGFVGAAIKACREKHQHPSKA
jgi:CTP synthase